MKCPSCGARSLGFMGGEQRVCLSCGYGGSIIMERIEEKGPSVRVPVPGSGPLDAPSRLNYAVNRFGFRLLASLSRIKPAQNLVISPPGLFATLALLAHGAAGETAQSLLRGLDLSAEELPEAACLMGERSPGHSGHPAQSNPAVSAALFARKKLAFHPQFQSDALAADVEVHSFNPMEDNAGSPLRAWLRDHSRASTTFPASSPDPLAVLYALQAVAFRAGWPAAAGLLFQLPDGLRKKAPALQTKDWFPYLAEERFQLAGLPISGTAGRYTLYLARPDEQSSLEDLIRLLAAKRWETWLSRTHLTRGEITLPRFQLETNSDLTGALSELGLGSIFDELRANFEEMCPIPPMPDVFLSGFWTQASCTIREEPATTSAGTHPLRDLFEAVQTPFTLQADRPFFFALREKETGLLPLMGLLFDPK